MNKNEESKKEKRVNLSTVAMSLAIFVFIVFALLQFFICKNYDNVLARKISAYFPFPAIAVNYYNFIILSDIDEDVQSIKRFYENQDFSGAGLRVDFSTEDGKKRLKIKEKDVINKLISDKIIELVAKKKGIVISDMDVDQNVSRKINEFGGADKIDSNLKRLYGWSMEDFKKKIVRPSLYRDEMGKIIQSEYGQKRNEEQKKKINEALSRLLEGEDFTSVVREFSQGETVEQGGELGWFSREQILDDLAEASFSLKEGGRSGVVESEIGFHIIEMQEKKNEDGKELIRVRQIFRPKITLNDWLKDEMNNQKIWIFVDGYYWDSSSGLVEFSDNTLREFELNENSDIL